MSTRLSIIVIWLCFIILLILGIVMVASTGLCAAVPHGEDPTMFLKKQAAFGLLGLGGALFLSTVDYHKYRAWVKPMWWFVCILLVMCYLPGVGLTINGERRWVNLGIITFQPSELSKIVLMICMAHWYTLYREQAGTFWKGFAIPGGCIFAVQLLLILFEKDMGTAAALAMSGFCIMYVAGARGWLMGIALLVGALVLYYMATGSANRMERIDAWLNPQAYSQGAGRQQWISMLALARGGLIGVGLGDGIEKYGSLPFAHTDFIFAEVGEEWGLVGTLGVLLLFTMLTMSAIVMALRTSDTFGRLLATGVVCTIFWPAVLNMAVVTSLLPNTGLPLPLISYGGTNLVFTIASIGILTSVQRFTPTIRQSCMPTRRLKQNPRL